MKRNYILDTAVTLVLVTSCVLFVYFYVNKSEFNKLIIRFYPITANLELTNSACSPSSNWSSLIIKQATSSGSPNNQLLHLSPNGDIISCTNGYLGTPLLSNPTNTSTRFRYASISKLWTSDLILDLVKEEKLDLDSYALNIIRNRVSSDSTVLKKIKIEHLLLHRAGFSRTGLLGDDMFKNKKPICPNRLTELDLSYFPDSPGKTFNYSNLGYCLLGVIAEQVLDKNFQSIINERYQLQADNIQFLINKKLDDEAKYNYLSTSIMGFSDIFTAFDYPSLASSAGLSGSAHALAKQVKLMIDKPEPNILSYPEKNCNLSVLRDCYGYAMFPYQKNKDGLKVYFRDGALPGASSLVVVDQYGGITILLSSGQLKSADEIKMSIYDYLSEIYKP